MRPTNISTKPDLSKMLSTSSCFSVCPVQQDFETLDIDSSPCIASDAISLLSPAALQNHRTDETILGTSSPRVAEIGTSYKANVCKSVPHPVWTEPTRLLRPPVDLGPLPAPKRFFRSFWRGITLRAVKYDKRTRIMVACSDE